MIKNKQTQSILWALGSIISLIIGGVLLMKDLTLEGEVISPIDFMDGIEEMKVLGTISDEAISSLLGVIWRMYVIVYGSIGLIVLSIMSIVLSILLIQHGSGSLALNEKVYKNITKSVGTTVSVSAILIVVIIFSRFTIMDTYLEWIIEFAL